MTDSNVLLLLVLLGVMCGRLPATEVKSREDASRATIATHAAYLGLQRQSTLQLRGGFGKARRQNKYENQRILQAEQERPQQRREGIERKERLRAQLLARSKINEMRDRMLQEGATERDINKLEEAMWRGDPIDPRFAQAHDEAQEVRSRARDDDDDDDFQVMQGYSDTSSSTGSGERVQIFGPTPTEEEARANPRRYLPDFDPGQSAEEQVRLATTPQVRWGQRAPDLPNAEERLICLEQWNGEEAAQEAVEVEQAARAALPDCRAPRCLTEGERRREACGTPRGSGGAEEFGFFLRQRRQLALANVRCGTRCGWWRGLLAGIQRSAAATDRDSAFAL
jgi:hypothetical protein